MKQLFRLLIIFSIFVIIAVLGNSCAKEEDILIADFEGETYDEWQKTDEAFGPGPAKGRIGKQRPVFGMWSAVEPNNKSDVFPSIGKTVSGAGGLYPKEL